MSAKRPSIITTNNGVTTVRPSQGATLPRTQFSDDYRINRIQDATREAIVAAINSPIQNPNMIMGVTFSAGVSQAIQHKLGRKYTSFICCGHRGGGPAIPVVQSQLSALDASQITLQSANSGIVDILIW